MNLANTDTCLDVLLTNAIWMVGGNNDFHLPICNTCYAFTKYVRMFWENELFEDQQAKQRAIKELSYEKVVNQVLIPDMARNPGHNLLLLEIPVIIYYYYYRIHIFAKKFELQCGYNKIENY